MANENKYQLRWVKESMTQWSGFCDGARWASVYYTYSNGWAWGTDFTESGEWEIEDGFFTAQAAMNAAASAYSDWEESLEMDDEEEMEELSLQDIDEILGDILYEERREARMGW